MAPQGFDYAAALEIRSFAAPVVFAVLYLPLFAFFVAKAVRRPTYIYIVLALFCAVRVSAFVLRALLARVAADAESLHVLLAYENLYNVGFFGLLYSAYILVTDRVAAAKHPPHGPVSTLLRSRPLFRLVLTAAVAIGVTGAVQSALGTSSSATRIGNTLREVGIYIFLACSILVLWQTYFLARAEFPDASYSASTGPIGSTYGVYFLLLISALLVARESFFTATADKVSTQDKEALWYPLSAVTEFLAVVLFATPGLVPE